MAIPAGLKQSLVTYAETLGDAGTQALTDEFNAVFARLKANEGSAVVASSSNGRTLGLQITLTDHEWFTVLGEAIRELNGDSIRATSADFSCLRR